MVVHDITITAFQTDYQQYIFFGSWIFYFILGIYLGLKEKLPIILMLITGLVLVSLGGYLVVTDSQRLLAEGDNLIFATRFTRESVLVYATGFCLAGLAIGPKIATGWLVKLGQKSYQIYLGHTLILRLIFTWLEK